MLITGYPKNTSRPVNPRPALQPPSIKPLSQTDQLRNNSSLQSLVDQHLHALEELALQDFVSAGNNKQAKQIKLGRERVIGKDHSRRFILWPQEHIFVGTARHRVKFDELT